MEQQNKPFELEWDFLSYNKQHIIQKTENLLEKENIPIKWNQKIKYLWCWLTNNNDSSIIEPEYNFNIFINKYRIKNETLNTLSLTHQHIQFNTKINLAKAFSLSFYLIYSQVIPLIYQKMWILRKTHKNNLNLFLGFPSDSRLV